MTKSSFHFIYSFVSNNILYAKDYKLGFIQYYPISHLCCVFQHLVFQIMIRLWHFMTNSLANILKQTIFFNVKKCYFFGGLGIRFTIYNMLSSSYGGIACTNLFPITSHNCFICSDSEKYGKTNRNTRIGLFFCKLFFHNFL